MQAPFCPLELHPLPTVNLLALQQLFDHFLEDRGALEAQEGLSYH